MGFKLLTYGRVRFAQADDFILRQSAKHFQGIHAMGVIDTQEAAANGTILRAGRTGDP
ncbi:MAG: hypothetical protein AMXMBFR84_37370 [Candidatus Hydrogenedentota bacterium]